MSVTISLFIPPPNLVSIRLFSTSVSLFLPCKPVHLYHFSRFHIYMLIYDTCFSLSDLLHSVWQSLGPATSLQITQFRSFYGWVIFQCIYVPHFLYPFICWWTLRLLQCPGYCKQSCNEHFGTWLFLNYGFLRVYAQYLDC